MALDNQITRSRNATGPKQESKITPAFVWEVFKRWWAVTLPVGLLLAVGIGAVVFLMFEPIYEAKVLVMIGPRQPVVNSKVLPTDRRFTANQIALIRSEVVLSPVRDDEEIAKIDEIANADDQVAWMRSHLSVKPVNGSTVLFYLGYKSVNPKDAQKIANKIFETYESHVKGYESRRVLGLITTVDDVLTGKVAEVQRLRDEFRKQAIENLNWDPYAAGTNSQGGERTSLQALEKQIPDAIVEQAVLESRLARARAKLVEVEKQLGPSASPEQIKADALRMVSEAPAIRAYTNEIESVKAVIDGLAQSKEEADRRRQKISDIAAGDPTNIPKYNVLGRQVSMFDEQIAKEREHIKSLEADREQTRTALVGQAQNGRAGDLTNYRQTLTIQHQQVVSKLEEQLADLKTRTGVLQQQFNTKLDESKALNGRTFDLAKAEQDLKWAEEQMAMLATRVGDLKIEAQQLERVKLELEAEIPTVPVEEVPYKQMLLGGLGGMLIPFGLALLWEFRLGRITDIKQIEQQQNTLPVLAEIASFPTRSKKRSRRSIRQLRLFEESVHSLRTSLVLSRPIASIQVLAVTSSVSGEGKTTLAAQLAMSIARATGEPTLLIDGDMRAPDIEEIFELQEGSNGLAEVLMGEATLRDSIHRWDENCHVLPAGKLAVSPHKLLGNGVFTAAIKEARTAYKHIVIDTPPVLAAGEAMVMAKVADATILCAKRDVTRMEQFAKTRDKLEGAGANLAGCVFNDVPPHRYSYHYGYYAYDA